MARPPSAKSIIKNMKKTVPNPKTKIAGNFVLPNDSQVRGADDKLRIRGYTDGSVLFQSGGIIAEDNPNLFWDDTNNRLGIGRTDPNQALDVVGRVIVKNNFGYLSYDSAGNQATILNLDGNDDLVVGDTTHVDNIEFDVASVDDAMIIKGTSGFVGVGTASPNAKFHTAGGAIQLDDGQALQWGGTTDFILGSNASNLLRFFTNNAEAMQLLELAKSKMQKMNKCHLLVFERFEREKKAEKEIKTEFANVVRQTDYLNDE